MIGPEARRLILWKLDRDLRGTKWEPTHPSHAGAIRDAFKDFSNLAHWAGLIAQLGLGEDDGVTPEAVYAFVLAEFALREGVS